MKSIIKTTLFFLLAITSNVFADTYNAQATGFKSVHYTTVHSSASAACDAENGYYGYAPNTLVAGSLQSNGTMYCVKGSSNWVLITITWSCPSGGTKTGTAYPYTCTNAPSCPAGEVRNSSGVCVNSTGANGCPLSGVTAEVWVKTADVAQGAQSRIMPVLVSNEPELARTTIKDGCEYQYNASNYGGSCTTISTGTFCKFTASSTAKTAQESTGAQTPGISPPSGGAPATGSQGGSCITDSGGVITCHVAPDNSGRACGTINGAPLCINTTPGTGTINGSGYITSGKNCGYFNGQPVCASNNSSSATTVGCIVRGGVQQCINTDVATNQSSTTTTNQNGSVTKTTTTTNNIIGSGDTTTTTTTNTDGSTSTQTTTTPGTGAPAAVGTGTPTPGQTDCDKYPNTLGCQQVSNSTAFTPDPVTGPTEVQINSEAVQLTSGGSCPSPKSFSAFGGSYALSYEPICTFASQLQPIVVAVGGVISLLVLFSSI